MTIPSFLMGALIATLYGAAFHLWRGGGFGRLVFYIVLGWVGFWLGHWAGGALGWTFAALGPLNLGMATLTSAVVLLLGHWLSLVEIQRR
jgi:hypothetical protein